MENKYYTPTIEEFHVGFQFEYLSDNNTWESTDDLSITFMNNDNPISIIEYYLKESRIRVKLIDREDIESLGWKYNRINGFEYKKYVLNINNNTISIYVPGDYDGEEHHFKGEIKNKSELSKLMIQLGIN